MSPITQQQFDAYIASLPYPPNRFQKQVLEGIAFGDGNIMVSALAGSGKTTLLIQIAGLLQEMGVSYSDTLFIAFNKSIRDEMTERLPGKFAAINSHSLGNRALRDAIGKRTRPDGRKYRYIFSDTIDALDQHPAIRERLANAGKDVLESVLPYSMGKAAYHIGRRFAAIVGKLQLGMIDPNDIDAIRATSAHYGYDDIEGSITSDRLEALYLLAQPLMEIGEEDARNTGRITFDEMLYLPLKWDVEFPKYRYVLGDECQDFNHTQQEILFRSVADGGRLILVGDKNQAIYGFAGADAQSFDNMVERSGANVLPLNICYRCAPPILDYARAIVHDIEAWEDHPGPDGPGVYQNITDEDLHKHVKPGDMVLCRLNAPLISAYFTLIGNRVPARIIGRDVAATLIKTLDKVANAPGFSYGDIVPNLREYERMMQAQYAKDDKYETQAKLLEDTVECLVVCATNFTNCTSLDCLKGELEKLFPSNDDEDTKRDNAVTLCSVHRAKGLEAEHVVILSPDQMPMSHPKQQPWELAQEWNILYVAVTRAKYKLSVCGELTVKPLPAGEQPAEQDNPQVVEAEVVEEDAPVSPLAVLQEQLGSLTDDAPSDKPKATPEEIDRMMSDHNFDAVIADGASLGESLLADYRGRYDCLFCGGDGVGDAPFLACDHCDGEGWVGYPMRPPSMPAHEPNKHEVDAFLRSLPPGHKPSEQARRDALAHGINLNDHPGMTFVNPHERTSGNTPQVWDQLLFPASGDSQSLGIAQALPNTRPGASAVMQLAQSLDDTALDTVIQLLTAIKQSRQEDAKAS